MGGVAITRLIIQFTTTKCSSRIKELMGRHRIQSHLLRRLLRRLRHHPHHQRLHRLSSRRFPSLLCFIRTPHSWPLPPCLVPPETLPLPPLPPLVHPLVEAGLNQRRSLLLHPHRRPFPLKLLFFIFFFFFKSNSMFSVFCSFFRVSRPVVF